MVSETNSAQLVPPLNLLWRTDTAITTAVAGNGSLYGMTPGGRVVACRAKDGAVRWQSTGTYLAGHLSLQGSRLFAYRVGQGLGFIDDLGGTAAERLVLGFGATDKAHVSDLVADEQLYYAVVNQGLYISHQELGLQFAEVLGEALPYGLGLVSRREVVVVDGAGNPSRYRIGTESASKIWQGAPHGIEASMRRRPFVVTSNRIVIQIDREVISYNLANGKVAWRLGNVPGASFVSHTGVVYAADNGASLCAIRAEDGALLWQRQFIYEEGLQTSMGLVLVGDILYYGGTLRGNPDGAMLIAVSNSDGRFLWNSRSVTRAWAGGIPVVEGGRLFCFGGARTAGFGDLDRRPAIQSADIEVSPRPLTGSRSTFGAGEIKVNVGAAAKVSVAAYREREGLAAPLLRAEPWSVGSRRLNWTPGGAGGFTDLNQFGFMLFDFEENGGLAYTHAVMVAVNSFPDILRHWARNSIHAMAYNRYVNGYSDQTFRPDGLITRAESCTIIAKTLSLDAPAPAFKTKFTDMNSHWSRNFVLVLEEKGFVGGFAEPDGSFTFRPDAQMTRAQEARILVKAYEIPSAPSDFRTRFIDVAGHWAAPEILALEAAGFISGFREDNGTFTYRPDRNLTRAELCTVVVRVRHLA